MLKEIVLPPVDMKNFSSQPIDTNLIIMSHDFNANELVIPFYEANVFDTYEAFYSFQGNTSIIIQEVFNRNNEIRIPIVNDVRRHKGIFTIELNASSHSSQATLLKLNVMVKRSNIDSNSEFLFNHYYKLFEDYQKEIAELNNATQTTIKKQLKQAQENLQKVSKTLVALNDKVMVVNDTADGFMADVASKQADVTSKYNAFDTSVTQANQTIDDILALQPQFQAVLDETTGKDVISAPEIILARGGEADLKTRLDKEHQEVTAQLAQNAYFGIENQTDFVDAVRKTNAKPNTLYTKIRSDRNIEVCIPFKGNKSQQWYVDKDPNDDFMKLSGGFVSNYELSSLVIGTKGYDSSTGAWNTDTINNYTREVGATFTTEFTGNGVNFRHLEESRGGVIRFVVDEKPEWTLDYSTYGTSGSTKSVTLFEFLPDGEHTIVGTFMGDDPLNPPSSGVGTSRGWVYGGAGTWQILETKYSFIKEVEVFKMTSNKEFAIAVTPSGATAAQWIPEHNNIGSAFVITQAVYFDDELVTDWTGQSNYYQYSSVQIVQRMYGKHPDNVNNLVEFITIHTFNADGVFTKTRMNVLEDILINTGYAMMCPVNFAFTNKMVTSLDNSYEITSTIPYDSTNLSENDKALSYLFIGNSSYPNYVGAMTINQPKKTLRVGKDGRRTPLAWLEFRSSNQLAKLYLQVFENYQATAGEVFDFSGTYTIGEIPLANELYG